MSHAPRNTGPAPRRPAECAPRRLSGWPDERTGAPAAPPHGCDPHGPRRAPPKLLGSRDKPAVCRSVTEPHIKTAETNSQRMSWYSQRPQGAEGAPACGVSSHVSSIWGSLHWVSPCPRSCPGLQALGFPPLSGSFYLHCKPLFPLLAIKSLPFLSTPKRPHPHLWTGGPPALFCSPNHCVHLLSCVPRHKGTQNFQSAEATPGLSQGPW